MTIFEDNEQDSNNAIQRITKGVHRSFFNLLKYKNETKNSTSLPYQISTKSVNIYGKVTAL
jgi:hypothetical protein